MASTAELEAEILADLEENPDAYTAPVNDVITIDPETKTINLPLSEVLFGTEEEQGVERKYFKCPRIVGDNIDLFTHQIYISYMAVRDKNATFIPDSIPQPYWCDDVALDETGNYITFSWLLSGNVLASRGFVGFAVIAKSVEGDILKTRWKTAPAVGTVLMTVPDAGEGIAELYPDIITQLLDRMDAVEEIATVEAMQGYVNEYLNENPPTGMTVGEKAQLNKNTEDISQLYEEMKNLDVRSIADIQKTASELLMDTYTITYTDGTSSTFQVTNGSSDEAYIASVINSWLDEHPEATTTVQDGSITIEKLSTDVMEVIEKASKSVEYKWIPRGLMREQIKTFQGWAHCVRYDERLRKAVGIVMAGEAAHTNELPLYRVIIDDNGNMSDYEEITLLDTDGVTEYVPSNGYICGFCILSDGTYLIQDNTWVGSYPSFYKSTDCGKTFTKIESTGNPTQAFGLRQLSTGRIISGSTGGSNCFYYSDDLGATWSKSSVCDVSVLGNPPFEADKYEFAEHCIIEFSNGKLLAIGRTSNNARNASGTVRGHLEGAAIAYSDDYGETWRDFGWSKTITNMTGCNAACVCINGIYHLVMGDRYTYTTDELGNRRYFAMYYQYATEEDALNDNWSEPVVIDYGHWTSDATTPTDSGYPSLWKDAVNNLHCVFYDGDGSGTAYGANWRLIDGSPCVESRAVSDEGVGSLLVSYSQAQVNAMLSAQKTALMKHINELYLLVGKLPDLDELDGSMFVTDGLVDYWEPENPEKWNSDASAVESSLGTGCTIIPISANWTWNYLSAITLSVTTSGLAAAGGFYTPTGLQGYGITEGITIEYYGSGDCEAKANHLFTNDASKVLGRANSTALSNAVFYFYNGVTTTKYTGGSHKVATITDDTVNIYINGEWIESIENTSDVATLAGLVYMFHQRNAALAQVRIYNRVLTDEEIKNNCAYTKSVVAALAASE